MLFKSWVPTVSLRLSFSEIGSTDYPKKCKTVNVYSGSERYVAIHQTRFLSDIPGFGLRFIQESIARTQGWTGFFHFTLVAITSVHNGMNLEKLKGKIFLSSKSQSSQGRIFKQNASALEAGLTTYPNAFTNLQRDMLTSSEVSADFELVRSGEFAVFNIKSLHSDLKEKEKWIANQIFYFVKDIAHKHQHHSPSSDTLISVHPADADDVTWRREVLYGLFRKVIQYKREVSQDKLFKSLGLLAYSRAFKRYCDQLIEQKVLHIGPYTNFPTWQDSELESSIRSAEALSNWRISKSIKHSDTIRNWSIWFFGIVIALVNIVDRRSLQQVAVPEYVSNIAQYAMQNLALVIVSVFAFSFLPSIVGVSKPWITERDWARDIQSLLLMFSRTVALVILLATILAIILIFYLTVLL